MYTHASRTTLNGPSTMDICVCVCVRGYIYININIHIYIYMYSVLILLSIYICEDLLVMDSVSTLRKRSIVKTYADVC